MSLPKKAATFPRRPGVYLFKGSKGDVLYVGKAKNLRNRVRSYFGKTDDRPQIKFLIRRTKDVEFMVTDSEKEALLLENTLIKRYRPRYNLELRDDKSYVSVRLGTDHEYPGICLTRRIRGDGAAYFGPYESSTAAGEAVDQIIKYFNIRSCSDREFSNRIRPCLKYDIGRCTAPCVKKVKKTEYDSQVDEAVMFLSGKSVDLIKKLRVKMQSASDDMRYEDAGRLRDAIGMLRDVMEKQKVVVHGGGDHDAVGLSREEGDVAVCVLEVRSGLLIGRRSFFSKKAIGSDEKIVEDFLIQHYREKTDIPPRIFLSIRPEGLSSICSILNDRGMKRVKVSVPARGSMLRLVKLASANANEIVVQKHSGRYGDSFFKNLAVHLGMNRTIDTVECIDISNLGGREAVGSIVRFSDGEPDKKGYRIYNIRTLDSPDDYQMIKEVVDRRFSGKSEVMPPDLLLVDGGKGQLAVVKRALGEISPPISIAAIAKGKKKGECDRVFIHGRKNPVKLKPNSKELLFLMRVRDEAHRFGLYAHRKRREKGTFNTDLTRCTAKSREGLVRCWRTSLAIPRQKLRGL